ncbi:MAG TPA: fibronectin type III domain-containing protein [Candidatus Limnocylindria bacterium]|nr:fibronectin type III domain-containing protein [Candidatus Limnocylindria bacterium]
MRMDRIIVVAFVVLVSTAIVGFSTGNTGASFTASSTNPSNSWNTVNVQPPATQNAVVSVAGGTVNLSWTATPTAPNGHTITYLVFRNATQIGTTASLVYSDTPPADGTYSYTIQTKIAQGAGFFTSGSSNAQNGISDRVAPTVSITCNAVACSSSTWYTVSPTVAITGTDTGIGMGTVTRNVDAGGNVSGASPMSFTPADGNHSIVYFGADAAGNVAASATQTLKVDTTAPTAATGIITAKGAAAGSITLTWTAGTDGASGSGVSGYTIHRSGVVASCPATNTTNYPNATPLGVVTSATISGLVSASKYCFYITTTDIAGNSADSVSAGPQPAR